MPTSVEGQAHVVHGGADGAAARVLVPDLVGAVHVVVLLVVHDDVGA